MAESASFAKHETSKVLDEYEKEVFDDVLAEGLSEEEIVLRIQRLGQHIRNLKEQLKTLAGNEEQESALKADIKRHVDLLLALKHELPEDHVLRPEVRSKEVMKERKARPRKSAYRMLDKAELSAHRIQRKIHNTFAKLSGNVDEDEEEDDQAEEADAADEEVKTESEVFKLDPNKFNVEKTGLDFKSGVVIATEKWDGTTMQANRHGIFKRRDLLPRGSVQKFVASEAERYGLLELDINHPSNRNLKDAVKRHIETFKLLPEGLTIYFEACGPKIQTRYREAMAETGGLIRVFDSSLNGQFLPFERTEQICREFNLPIVHSFIFSTPIEPKGPNAVVEFLRKAKKESFKYTLLDEKDMSFPVELEGYVFKDATDPYKVAKLRLGDLPHLE